jgi:uncharacterized protein YehS (DUF1456 family)
MINNDLLRRISTIFELTDEKIITIFALSECEISADQLTNFFKEKDDSAYQEIEDVQFSSFLNGLITAQRGQSEGPARENEQELTNNMIFNKVKIALSLKAEEVISVLELAELSLDKHELSALFRNVSNIKIALMRFYLPF